MLFKMLGIERSWEVNCFVGPKPRQVFVTQSRVLASKVEEYFGKLLNSLASARGTSEDVEQAAKAMDRLVDEDEEENWRGDLPLSFSALEDHHFPLFVTYDRVRLATTSACSRPNYNTSAVQTSRSRRWHLRIVPYAESDCRISHIFTSAEPDTRICILARCI
jgi:hypothetical protein